MLYSLITTMLLTPIILASPIIATSATQDLANLRTVINAAVGTIGDPDNPFKGWEQHFRFGQYAASYKIQHLGNEAGLPTLDAIGQVAREFDQEPGVELRPTRENVAPMRASR